MTLADLKRLAELGEGVHLEFKRRIPRPERFAREAIAFANTWGGTLLVGVDDDGTLTGVKDLHEEFFALTESLQEYVDPDIDFSIQTTRIRRRRDVIVVNVPESKRKPHYLVSKEKPGSRTAFVRVEDRTVAASKELRRLLRTQDSETGVQFEFGDAEHALMRYLDRYHSITLPEFSRLADIPMHRASRTLVLLTRARIVDLHPGEDLDTYTLSAEKNNGPTGLIRHK